MHPAIFIGAWLLLGLLFASQEWMSMRSWSSERFNLVLLLKAGGAFYLIWGILCWLVWWWLGPQIERAGAVWLMTRMLPLSVAVSVVQEMIWVGVFPNLPMSRPHMDYWHRLEYRINGEFFDNLVIAWCAFGLFRGIGYYMRFREKEAAAAQLEVQLANARIAALRMQLNPHFLFNTMNSISSLMRTDVGAADSMLEQLSSLLRITLERGDAQLIPLRDEIEFIELYLAMQERRFGSRIRQSLTVDAELHDALVPAMILQPIVENAYAHGLSKLDGIGLLTIEAHRDGQSVRLSVTNSGVGIQKQRSNGAPGQGLGLTNVRDRLRLHYGADHSFTMRELERNQVRVTVTFPLQMSERPAEQMASFGV
jgi:two-component system LytT family sensor kinase